jgi:lipoprotein-releasing system permease protein
MALIVVLAVMSGFDRELKSKIVNVQPHLRIEKFGGVDDPGGDMQKIWNWKIPHLLTAASFVEGQAILRSEKNATGVIVKGLDDEREDLAIFKQHMLFGSIDLADRVTAETKRRSLFFKRVAERRQGAVLIGEELAAVLRVQVGDSVAVPLLLKEFFEWG